MLSKNLIHIFTTLAVGMVPFVLLTWLIIQIRKRNISRKKNPINTHLLRSPGQSLLAEAEDTNSDFFAYLLLTPFICLFLYASYPAFNKNTITSVSLVVMFIGFLLFLGNKVLQLSFKREKLKLGYDAELAIGQELNQLMRDGFYVFHDLNLKNTISEFNIDHIVVGKSGVFAVETKGRSKPINKDGKHDFKVSFDGKKLVFPQREETEPVEQAKRQAKALQKWLSSAVGEPISVRAVIALPGWFIERIGKHDVAVINGKNHESYFNKVRGTELSEKQIKQIAHQLDSLCRNVEPKAFSMPK